MIKVGEASISLETEFDSVAIRVGGMIMDAYVTESALRNDLDVIGFSKARIEYAISQLKQALGPAYFTDMEAMNEGNSNKPRTRESPATVSPEPNNHRLSDF